MIKNIINCSVKSVTPNMTEMYNTPVNISRIINMSMSHKGYSSCDMYIIDFHFESKCVRWMYPSRHARDRDYNAILDNYSTNMGDI